MDENKWTCDGCKLAKGKSKASIFQRISSSEKTLCEHCTNEVEDFINGLENKEVKKVTLVK
jgi:hypothetical protein